MIALTMECAVTWDPGFSSANVLADTQALIAFNIFCVPGTVQDMAFAKMGSVFVQQGSLELTALLPFG